MDPWKYFDITHRDHVVCNPTNSLKLRELVELVALPENARVLDIACGKAEFLVFLVERYGCSGVGIDLSPYFIDEAQKRATERVPNARIAFQEVDGASYEGEADSFDLVTCLGASWIWQGHRGTLAALMHWAKPGALILVGEPFWQRDPDEAYLAADGLSRDSFDTPLQNVEGGLQLGLTLLYTSVSSGEDWDRYESLQWRAAEIWAQQNPDDPDRDSVITRCRRARDSYLRWGRDSLGWALYLFRK